MRRRQSLGLRTVLVCASLLVGCATAGETRASNEVVRRDLERARHSGAYRCAPRELATAEANVDFSENELRDGHPIPAHDFSLIAQDNVHKALDLSKDCGPKEVVIQERAPQITVVVKDTDGDGVPDDVDRCPTVPGPKENFGCPYGDRDHDGIPDNLDKCPDVPGVPPDGCPPPPPPKVYSLVVVKKDRIEIKQQVHFATNKSKILPDSFALLNQVVQAINDNPSFKIHVEGHTDNVGTLKHNMKLSTERAESVMEYMIEHGVDASRLTSDGYGPTQPIASNSTKKGKAQNRRVEFKIVGQDQTTAPPDTSGAPSDSAPNTPLPTPAPEAAPAPEPQPAPQPAPAPDVTPTPAPETAPSTPPSALPPTPGDAPPATP